MDGITRFIPKAERMKAEQINTARQMILDLGLPEKATDDFMILLQRHESGGVIANWNFNMISPAQSLIVWNAIEEYDRPGTIRSVFFHVLTHIETNTGLVTLTREELAEKVGTTPEHVSRAMKCLEEIGVITRERVKVAGMRGPGIARYRMNPHVAWNGSLEKRKAQAEQKNLPLEVIDGGRD